MTRISVTGTPIPTPTRPARTSIEEVFRRQRLESMIEIRTHTTGITVRTPMAMPPAQLPLIPVPVTHESRIPKPTPTAMTRVATMVAATLEAFRDPLAEVVFKAVPHWVSERCCHRDNQLLTEHVPREPCRLPIYVAVSSII
jgi:hypothetical protein